ncbi:MAG: glycosyltransferase family 39 protein [Deltaproteobacteria bacterium]|nr:glycosyltransferase family 39 protein [Deltaproteobacteria bacterium]
MNFILCLPGLWVPYFNIDETTNALFAQFINNGELGLSYFLGNTYLLTHYLFAWVNWIFGADTLVAMHIVHAFWRGGTILALYAAGRAIQGHKAGIWSAWFYCLASVSFMSKDFQTPSAESLSLLPAALSALYLFKHQNAGGKSFLFLAGVFAAAATMFKAPMGMLLVAGNLFVLINGKRLLPCLALFNGGYLAAILAPALFVMPFGQGFVLMAERLRETHTTYIRFYDDFGFIYWALKFLIRTLLVMAPAFALYFFAGYNFKTLFHLRRNQYAYWQKIFFLFVWLFLMWGTVAIGKRVFYHYFVFLLVPLSLLGGTGVRLFDLSASIGRAAKTERLFPVYAFLRRHLFLLILIPAVGFAIEGAFNFSTLPPQTGQTYFPCSKDNRSGRQNLCLGGHPAILFFVR